jgi:hypothetical protein
VVTQAQDSGGVAGGQQICGAPLAVAVSDDRTEHHPKLCLPIPRLRPPMLPGFTPSSGTFRDK